MSKMIADPANRDIVRDLLRLSRLPTFSYSLFKKTYSLDALGGCIEEEKETTDGDAKWWAVLDSRLHSDDASSSPPSETDPSETELPRLHFDSPLI